MKYRQVLILLAVAGMAAGQVGTAAAQQSQARKPAPAQSQQAKQYFDMYEPAQRLRMRRETCQRKEQSYGAFCVKACRSGYVAMTGTKPPRCRSLTPLPPGQFPGAVRREVDTPARIPQPAVKSDNPKHGW